MEPQVYRMTRDEVARLLAACQTPRETRAIHLGVCAGLRRAELLGLQGRHFLRPGFVWVSADIAKRGTERFVPVIADLEPVAHGILERVEPDEYVLPAQRWRDPGANTSRRDYRLKPSSEQALWRLVRTVGARAGIAHPLRPHMLRHAFADHIARYAGMRNAQFLLGHKGIGTTEAYLGEPTLDELVDAVVGFSFGPPTPPPVRGAVRPVEATTGIEPVSGSSRTVERLSGVLRRLYASPVLRGAVR
jgi:integrase